ncbi:peptide/nickel transport system ATP-binding protein [Lederbergia galactosidilyticus]|uniref:ABC transporter ATP-binding protein n=1 Tax=Lederbergia galactosidilytica TaxID=217031 RepID=UPI001AE27BC8|nr:ABC transporter ATP-binding protein [Lederbergia galactosidilytica]MBP1916531.1 peptide/nickel transport system ATP-binding protein [Lederbergia galactosidilytica]
MAEGSILQVNHLLTQFQTEAGKVNAVNDVSFEIKEGQTVCLVGESGCGKSATAMSIMGLIDHTSGAKCEGEIIFEGKDLLKMKMSDLRRLRGNDFAMIFQEPMTSLNPVLTIGEQIIEPLMEHTLISKKQAKQKAIELIELVGIGRSREIFSSYPHQLSGGMLQRIMIAIALCCNPRLLIADEPTTALDVTIQAQILELLRKLKEERQMSMLLITHDLGVVAEVADYVIVMYAGKVIEHAPVVELFKNPKHPYTKGLLAAKPVINQRKETLYTIPGQVPNLIDLQPSCYFSDRCEHCMSICVEKSPGMKSIKDDHQVACWLYEEEVIV